MVHHIFASSPDDGPPDTLDIQDDIRIARNILEDIRKMNHQSGFVTPHLLDQIYALIQVG